MTYKKVQHCRYEKLDRQKECEIKDNVTVGFASTCFFLMFAHAVTASIRQGEERQTGSDNYSPQPLTTTDGKPLLINTVIELPAALIPEYYLLSSGLTAFP